MTKLLGTLVELREHAHSLASDIYMLKDDIAAIHDSVDGDFTDSYLDTEDAIAATVRLLGEMIGLLEEAS